MKIPAEAILWGKSGIIAIHKTFCSYSYLFRYFINFSLVLFAFCFMSQNNVVGLWKVCVLWTLCLWRLTEDSQCSGRASEAGSLADF